MNEGFIFNPSGSCISHLGLESLIPSLVGGSKSTCPRELFFASSDFFFLLIQLMIENGNFHDVLLMFQDLLAFRSVT